MNLILTDSNSTEIIIIIRHAFYTINLTYVKKHVEGQYKYIVDHELHQL
jgi:hypothetical protein